MMPHKILIVEDNENNSCLFRDILKYHGDDLSVATDEKEKFISAGLDGHLSKSTNTPALSGLIDRWLDVKVLS